MNSYQKLKAKCEYLQGQVDIFKNALTIVRQEPQVIENFSEDSISLTMRTLYVIRENKINEDIKRRLNDWVALNLDKETIERLLKLKDKLEKMNKLKDYNEQLIGALHSFFWYEGLLDQDYDEWIDFKNDKGGYIFSRPKYKEDDVIHRLIKDLRNYDHNTINFYTREDGDKLFDEDDAETFKDRYSMLWQMLVTMFGGYGTSPRTGWIEERDECADFLEMVVRYDELIIDSENNQR